MNQKEREVCSRIRQFRESIKWSQSEFASTIGLNRDRLANIEYQRIPLRYETAWWICNLFEQGPEFLLGFETIPLGKTAFPMPTPRESGFPKSALFTTVFEHYFGKQQPDEPKKNVAFQRGNGDSSFGKIEVFPDADGRVFAEEWIARDLREWFAVVPDDKLNELINGICHFAERYLSQFEPDQKEVELRRKSMQVAREKLKHRRILLKAISKAMLDNKSSPLHDVDVQTNFRDLRDLIDHLKKCTSMRGAKSALAKEFNVTRQAVDQWLSGESKPSAEIAIRLQHWKFKPAK